MLSFGNMGELMRGAQGMQKKLAELQERLRGMTVTGESGGGAVRVTANGQGEVVRVEFDPAMVDKDRELLQGLMVAAVNQALARAREQSQKELSNLLGGFVPPGLAGLSDIIKPGG